MKITYSAPAKTILSGEHSVVYGKPALVSAINPRLEFTVTDEKTETDDHDNQKAIQEIQDIVLNYLKKNNINFLEKPFSHSISSDIPIGRGMGSSAAFSVAGVAALLHFFTGKEFDKSVINQLAYLVEKHFHGIPSGVDSSASCLGGLIFYRKEFEFLKQISSLNFKIPLNIQSKLFLIDSGKPEESTGEMVANVGKKYNETPKETDDLLCKIERITKRMVVSIVKEDAKLFQSAIEENNQLLSDLGIVSEITNTLLDELKQFGVGKVTGGGGKKSGSGFILFLAEDELGLQEYLKTNAISCFKFSPDVEGVKKI